jgi:hypothetical protein
MNKLQTVLDALEKAKRQVIHANIAPHGCINEAITSITSGRILVFVVETFLKAVGK